MKNPLLSELLEATRLTNGGRLTEATAALQRVLGGRVAPAADRLPSSTAAVQQSSKQGHDIYHQRLQPIGVADI
jgi:hypothetical protein